MIGEDTAANLAEAFLRFRRVRSDILPYDMFGEPAWELMLQLFVADSKGRQISGRQAALQSNVSHNVLSRWLMYLTGAGLIVGDGTGNLDDPLTLSANGIGKMEQVMDHARLLKDLVGGAGG